MSKDKKTIFCTYNFYDAADGYKLKGEISSIDISTSVGKPNWFILPDTKIGIMGIWRSLDQYSPRYSPTFIPANTFPAVPPKSPVGFPNGSEWEIRTYIHINIGK